MGNLDRQAFLRRLSIRPSQNCQQYVQRMDEAVSHRRCLLLATLQHNDRFLHVREVRSTSLSDFVAPRGRSAPEPDGRFRRGDPERLQNGVRQFVLNLQSSDHQMNGPNLTLPEVECNIARVREGSTT